MYNYLIIGSSLYGATFANLAHAAGKTVLVIDKRPHIGGNVYTARVEGINVHQYGAHIFYTNDKDVWECVNRFATFNRFTNSPVANYKDKLYLLPFKTVISREYSSEWKLGDEPYYPVNDEKSSALYAKYQALAEKEPSVLFGGRLGRYRYYDMDQVITATLNRAAQEW